MSERGRKSREREREKELWRPPSKPSKAERREGGKESFEASLRNASFFPAKAMGEGSSDGGGRSISFG